MTRIQVKAWLASLTLLTTLATVRDAAAQSCQQLSDTYAIVANKGFGFAPENVRTAWRNAKCATNPAAAKTKALCQELSNRFNISGPRTGTDPEAKAAYAAMGCTTKSSCQVLSDTYAVVASKGFGFAPTEARDTWRALSCATTPAKAKVQALCQQLSNHFGLGGGLTGTADAEAKGAFTGMGCRTKPTCQGLSDSFAVVAKKGFGFAPADLQTFFAQNKCATRPTAIRMPSLCQELSNRFGISGPQSGTDAEGKASYVAMGCTTKP